MLVLFVSLKSNAEVVLQNRTVIFFYATSLRSLPYCRTIPITTSISIHRFCSHCSPILHAMFAWTYQSGLLVMVQCFSLTTYQRTVLFSLFRIWVIFFGSSPLPQLPWEDTKNGVVSGWALGRRSCVVLVADSQLSRSAAKRQSRPSCSFSLLGLTGHAGGNHLLVMHSTTSYSMFFLLLFIRKFGYQTWDPGHKLIFT